MFLGAISLPMTWLHVYADAGRAAASLDRRVSGATGFGASIELYGFDVNLWIPIVLSIALSTIVIFKGYGLVEFSRWRIDFIACLIAVLILLPLWPCYLGSAYAGLGWYLGAACVGLTIFTYVTEFRSDFPTNGSATR